MAGNTPVPDVVDAPTIGTATAGVESATVTFTAATTGGAATTFGAISTPGSVTGTSATSPITVSGLTAATAYTFKTYGINSSGTWSNVLSAASNSVTPTVPAPYESISTVTVGAGGQASVEFTSIPATYKHLQIRTFCKATVANNFVQSIFGRFNSDTGSNYARHFINGSGSAVAQNGFTSQTSMFFGTDINADANNIFAASVIDILDYANTNKYKTTRSLSGVDTNGSGYVQFMSGLWLNTAAVTSITILPNADNFAQYSHFALYGIRGG